MFGIHCICDALPGIGVEHFVFWMVYPVLGMVNLIIWRRSHFWGWVFGDLDDIFDSDYAIWDDYLVPELIYFVFLLRVIGMLGNIFDIWEHPCLHFGLFVLMIFWFLG